MPNVTDELYLLTHMPFPGAKIINFLYRMKNGRVNMKLCFKKEYLIIIACRTLIAVFFLQKFVICINIGDDFLPVGEFKS
jgi:hypothetical protein